MNNPEKTYQKVGSNSERITVSNNSIPITFRELSYHNDCPSRILSQNALLRNFSSDQTKLKRNSFVKLSQRAQCSLILTHCARVVTDTMSI